MGTIQNVVIPSDHFAKQVTNIYCKPLEALLREVVQNSKDAGASYLRILATPTQIIFEDDGCGMNEETLKAGMLTMSGSIKKEGDTGGFGAAKELILFAQEGYEIETNDLYAYGSCLSYMLDRKEFRKGTKITITPHPLFKYNEHAFEDTAMQFVRRCHFEMKVLVGSSDVRQAHLGNLYKELPWCNIFVNEVDSPTERLRVLHNGLLMFERRIEESNTQISLEIKGKSTDCLTTSRDGLRWEKNEDLDKLLLDIGKSQGNFGKMYQMITTWRGFKPFIETLRETLGDAHVNEVLSYVPNAGASDKRSDQLEAIERMVASATMPMEVIKKLEAVKKALTADIENDFKVRIDKKGYDEVPEELRPSHGMKKRYEVIAKLWKAALHEIGEIYYRMPSRYTIGFIISDDAQAMYHMDNGNACFYINPYSEEYKNAGSDVEVVHKIIVTACHEAAHHLTDYHGTSWQSEFESLIIKFFTKCNVSDVRKLAREISL